MRWVRFRVRARAGVKGDGRRVTGQWFRVVLDLLWPLGGEGVEGVADAFELVLRFIGRDVHLVEELVNLPNHRCVLLKVNELLRTEGLRGRGRPPAGYRHPIDVFKGRVLPQLIDLLRPWLARLHPQPLIGVGLK